MAQMRTLAWCITVTLGVMALVDFHRPAEATFNRLGSLTLADPTFARPNTLFPCSLAGANTFRHEVHTLTGHAGDIQIIVSSSGLSEPRALLYRGAFSSASPCTNLITLPSDRSRSPCPLGTTRSW